MAKPTKEDLDELADEIRFPPRVIREQLFGPRAKTIEGWVIVIDREEEPFARANEFKEMRDFIQQNNKFKDYIVGICLAYYHGKKDIAQELEKSMLENHPFLGRIADYPVVGSLVRLAYSL